MKNPGKFSFKYMSNPVHSKIRNNNKENRNLNGTFDECSIELTCTPERLYPKSKIAKEKKQEKINLQKMKEENEKQKKEIKLMKGTHCDMLDQIKRLKEKNNEQIQTICQYEAYIEEVREEKESIIHEKNRYKEHLKYSILWFVEAFSLSNTNKTSLLNTKFIDYFHRLKPMVSELQIERELREVYQEETKTKEEYLHIQEEEEYNEPELHTLLDTFNIREEEEQVNEDENCNKIARKLFSPSCQPVPQNFPKEEDLKGKEVMVKANYEENNEDFLQVQEGEKVKMLRKIGNDLWIAENGNSIGYINTKLLSL